MNEKRKAIFIDKDGTLIPDIPYNINPDLITLSEGVIEGLTLLKEDGYIFVVISNQAGIARGYFTLDKLEHVKEKLDKLLEPHQLKIEGFYFCPHHPAGKVPEYSIACNCRKPEPGMLLKAIEELNIDPEKSWMVGDILNDIEAGNRAGCRTVLVDTGNETEWISGPYRTPDFKTKTFLEAATFIHNNPYESKELNDKKLAAL
jgi:D,D-heptose 1,7-bisphosphate phosphatase